LLKAQVEDLVGRWKLPCRIEVAGDLDRVPGSVASVAYVVVREAVANAAKHAAGSSVRIELKVTDGLLTVAVSDGGRGFSAKDEDAARDQHHMGLQMLRRRVAEAGGGLEVESSRDRGTRLLARLPLDGALA
jgi:signal transduction histidine kinase